MSSVTFDTDDLIQKLSASGINPDQARAIVRAMVEAQTELATKNDLVSLEHRMVIKIGAICAASISIAIAIAGAMWNKV